MDGCPLGLGLVAEDKPTEFSCTCTCKMYKCSLLDCFCFIPCVFSGRMV